MKYPSKRKGNKAPRKRAYKRKPVGKPTRSFVKQVQKIIHKEVETKVAIFNSNVTAFNQQMSFTADALRLLPDIQQTSGQAGRVGNLIKVQSLNIRGVLTFALGQTNAAYTRIGVRMMIVRPKAFKDWNSAAAVFGNVSGIGSYTRLLEGSNSGFTGSLSDFNCPPNTDAFSVIVDKRFYMSQSQAASTAGGHSVDVTNTTKFINMKIPYISGRNLHYDDNSTQPLDYPYFLLLGYTKLDGTAQDLPAVSNLTFQYNTTCRYEDA